MTCECGKRRYQCSSDEQEDFIGSDPDSDDDDEGAGLKLEGKGAVA